MEYSDQDLQCLYKIHTAQSRSLPEILMIWFKVLLTFFSFLTSYFPF